MFKVQVFCARGPYCYGFGITAKAAAAACAEAGHLKSKELPALSMIRLPDGAVEIGVNEMGGCEWIGGAEGPAVKLVYDKATRDWIEPKAK